MPQEQKLTFGGGTGFRAPDLKELYLEFVDINHNITGNPDLKPEQSVNGFFMHEKKWKKNKAIFEMKTRLSYNNIRDGISLVQSEDGINFSYQNIAKQETAGIQMRNKFVLKNWETNLNFAFNGNTFIGLADQWNFSPELSASTSYLFEKLDASISLFYRFNGAQRIPLLVDDQLTFSTRNPLHWMDVSIPKNF